MQNMKISGYENIEIFNKTQRFGINKYENQVIRPFDTMAFYGLRYNFYHYPPAVLQGKRLFLPDDLNLVLSVFEPYAFTELTKIKQYENQ
jgi:hypothetical protein